MKLIEIQIHLVSLLSILLFFENSCQTTYIKFCLKFIALKILSLISKTPCKSFQKKYYLDKDVYFQRQLNFKKQILKWLESWRKTRIMTVNFDQQINQYTNMFTFTFARHKEGGDIELKLLLISKIYNNVILFVLVIFGSFL